MTGVPSSSHGSGASPLLAYSVATAGTNQTTTSSSLADVDATNAAVTFAAPASGIVLVVVTAQLSISNVVANGQLGLREATTNIAGPNTVITGNATVSLAAVITSVFKVSGISAGSHTYKLAFASTGGVNFSVLNVGSSASNFPVTLQVLAG